MRRLGCLVVVIFFLAAAWLTRDRWRPLLPAWVPGSITGRSVVDSVATAGGWAPLSAGAAARAERALNGLGERNSPVFVTLRPAEFASYMVLDLAGRLPPESDSARVAVVGDQLLLRTSLDLRSIGRQSLGALASVLGQRAPLLLSGRFSVVRPGVAEFRVEDLTLHDMPVPSALIPQLVHKVESGPHPQGLAPNALLVNVPPYVADIRAVRGRITVYKNQP